MNRVEGKGKESETETKKRRRGRRERQRSRRGRGGGDWKTQSEQKQEQGMGKQGNNVVVVSHLRDEPHVMGEQGKVLIVSRLPESYKNEKKLREFFEEGGATNFSVVIAPSHHHGKDAYVTFPEIAAADRARKKLGGRFLIAEFRSNLEFNNVELSWTREEFKSRLDKELSKIQGMRIKPLSVFKPNQKTKAYVQFSTSNQAQRVYKAIHGQDWGSGNICIRNHDREIMLALVFTQDSLVTNGFPPFGKEKLARVGVATVEELKKCTGIEELIPRISNIRGQDFHFPLGRFVEFDKEIEEKMPPFPELCGEFIVKFKFPKIEKKGKGNTIVSLETVVPKEVLDWVDSVEEMCGNSFIKHNFSDNKYVKIAKERYEREAYSKVIDFMHSRKGEMEGEEWEKDVGFDVLEARVIRPSGVLNEPDPVYTHKGEPVDGRKCIWPRRKIVPESSPVSSVFLLPRSFPYTLERDKKKEGEMSASKTKEQERERKGKQEEVSSLVQESQETPLEILSSLPPNPTYPPPSSPSPSLNHISDVYSFDDRERLLDKISNLQRENFELKLQNETLSLGKDNILADYLREKFSQENFSSKFHYYSDIESNNKRRKVFDSETEIKEEILGTAREELEKIGLESYATRFEEENISSDLFSVLEIEDLSFMKIGDRRKFLKHFQT